MDGQESRWTDGETQSTTLPLRFGRPRNKNEEEYIYIVCSRSHTNQMGKRLLLSKASIVHFCFSFSPSISTVRKRDFRVFSNNRMIELPATQRKQLSVMKQAECEPLADFTDGVTAKTREGDIFINEDTLYVVTKYFLGVQRQKAAYAASEGKPSTIYKTVDEMRGVSIMIEALIIDMVSCRPTRILAPPSILILYIDQTKINWQSIFWSCYKLMHRQ